MKRGAHLDYDVDTRIDGEPVVPPDWPAHRRAVRRERWTAST